LDGTNIQENLLNGITTTANVNRVSVDRIEEFRVITSPADAEYGRGSGQVQAVTRSGTNSFRGSLFEEHRNTVLTANSWFNNRLGTNALTGEPNSPRDDIIRNQFGGRIGGPFIKNKSFFFFLYEGDRRRSRTTVASTTYTATARQGIYRYFPGVANAAATAARPTVDFQGNPISPVGATGALRSVNLFGLDPLRPADP